MKNEFYKYSIIIGLIITSSVFCGPQIGMGIAWAPTVEITDSSGGSPMFVETGTFYDEFVPEVSLMWDFGSISLGGICTIPMASDAFAQGQPTSIVGLSLGGKFIYNYVMHESGDWLFPMTIDSGWLTYQITYRPSVGDISFRGEGWKIRAAFGVERVWDRKYSLGFLMGRRFSRTNFNSHEYGISPSLNGDNWFFTLTGRLGFPNIQKK